METLRKAWLHTERRVHQRTLQEMEDDRGRQGTSGSCFDLALWLRDAFAGAHIDAFLIGTALDALNQHVAVCAIGPDGERYLCDLGDQWIQPILLDEVRGRFECLPLTCEHRTIRYIRHGGGSSQQTFSLRRMRMKDVMQAAEISQCTLRYPLCDVRLYGPIGVEHWALSAGRCRVSGGSRKSPRRERSARWRSAWL